MRRLFNYVNARAIDTLTLVKNESNRTPKLWASVSAIALVEMCPLERECCRYCNFVRGICRHPPLYSDFHLLTSALRWLINSTYMFLS